SRLPKILGYRFGSRRIHRERRNLWSGCWLGSIEGRVRGVKSPASLVRLPRGTLAGTGGLVLRCRSFLPKGPVRSCHTVRPDCKGEGVSNEPGKNARAIRCEGCRDGGW